MSDKEVIILEEITNKAKVLTESGLFPDIKSQSQAMVKIWAGRELGLSDFQSLQGFYIVKQGLSMAANLMAALIKKNPKYDYSVDKHDDKECAITFYSVRDNERTALGTSTYTFADAAKAGLVNKDSWKNYPKNMMFARALSNGARWYCPDAIGGFYTVEEMNDIPVKADKNKIIEAIVHDPNEDTITPEQGQALVTMVENKGYSIRDLEVYILDSLGVASISNIKNGQLLNIKDKFKIKKEK